jgi:dTMP kinase
MAKKNMKGLFITFEGPEGSGKSTHSKLLCRYLRKKGYEVIHAREPGGTIIGEKIRKILLDPRNKNMHEICELFLYIANRAQVVKEIILPALKKGAIVICDRFLDATVAYQGYGSGLDIKLIRYIGRLATGGIKPDLTILLDIDTLEGLKRSKRHDRMENKTIGYHRRVRKGYLTLAKEEPGRIKLIKIKDEVTKTQGLISEIVLRVIKERCHSIK